VRLLALESEPTAFGESAQEHRRTSVGLHAERLRTAGLETIVVGAFEGETLAGTVGFRRDQALKRRHRGVIWGMFVAPEFRGRGVGYALLKDLLQRVAQIPGITCIYLSVAETHPDARRLYIRCGFVPYGTEPQGLLVDGQYVREEHLVLLLSWSEEK